MSENDTRRPLDGIREQLAEAAAAGKCHPCGCLHDTVAALEATDAGRGELARDLAKARAVLAPRRYDCLGCPVCYPAIAANLYGEAFPGTGLSLEVCPTDQAAERRGWPPLPGDYHVLRYQAPVAACTLNSDELAAELARDRPDGLAMVGMLHTENLGIERLVRNVIANPHIRRLVLCGADTREAVGHLPGQSLESLFARGLDEDGRIRGARGRRPVLKNVTRAQVEAFRRQVDLLPLLGELDAAAVTSRVKRAAEDAPGAFEGSAEEIHVATFSAREPRHLVPDPAGYCVIYPDRARKLLLLEHYTNAGVLDCVVEGPTPAAVYAHLIDRGLVSRLDHAAYLGRELARAQASLGTGDRYVQDRAPGKVGPR
jgi:tetrahydromethanopterin S-methyltransferase subunit A